MYRARQHYCRWVESPPARTKIAPWRNISASHSQNLAGMFLHHSEHTTAHPHSLATCLSSPLSPRQPSPPFPCLRSPLPSPARPLHPGGRRGLVVVSSLVVNSGTKSALSSRSEQREREREREKASLLPLFQTASSSLSLQNFQYFLSFCVFGASW